MKQILLILLLFPLFTEAQIITTIAGNGTAGYFGDGAPATVAKLEGPYRARPDASGNVFIADLGNNFIRKVNTAGIITNVAGNGTGTHGGDGGLANAAGIIITTSIAVDNGGNLYIAEDSNVNLKGGSWVRKVNTSGVITTIAGNGKYGYTGDGSPATAAEFNHIGDIAVDGAGNIYIADTRNYCIRKINTAGIISTIAGNNTNGDSGDNGPATSAQFSSPNGVAVDTGGNVYIADGFANRIRKVNKAGIIITIAGNGSSGFSGDGVPATATELNNPYGVAVDSAGNVYIADWENSIVRKINITGIISTVAGNQTAGYTGDGGDATDAELSSPVGVAVDGIGNIYIGDVGTYTVRKVSASNTTGINITSIPMDALQISPNPATTSLTITSSDKIITIAITNLIGQTVYSNNYHNEEVQVDVSGLPAGMYLVRINGIKVRKFVKE